VNGRGSSKVSQNDGRPSAAAPNLADVVSGRLTQADFAITAEMLCHQANTARKAGRETLALNFERAAELVNVPAEEIMAIYHALRPGKIRDHAELLFLAARLRNRYRAEATATMIERAVQAYKRRGLFERRI